MPQPVDVPSVGTVPALSPRIPRASRTVLALLPLWILLLAPFAAPSFFDPMFASPPGIAGMPAGLMIQAIAMLLMALGVAVVRRTSSRTAAILAFALLTLPGAAIVILAPAAVLIVQDLAT